MSKLYEIGKTPSRGNFTPLELVEEHRAKDKTKYLVRFECCGTEKIVSGHSLDVRVARNSVTCGACRHDNKRREEWNKAIGDGVKAQRDGLLRHGDYGVKSDHWAVPPSAQVMPIGWVPR